MTDTQKLYKLQQLVIVACNCVYENNGVLVFPFNLTNKQFQISLLLCSGLSCRQIAFILHNSPKTISNHRTEIMIKVSVNNVLDLYKVFIQEKIILCPCGVDNDSR